MKTHKRPSSANCGEAAGYWLNSTAHLGTLLTAPHFCDETLQVYLTTGEIKTQPQPMPECTDRGTREAGRGG